MKNDKNGLLITDKIKFYNIYLPNIRKKCYNKKNKLSALERYLLVMIDENKVAKKYAKGDRIMKEFISEANMASEDNYVLGAYDKEMHERMKNNSIIKNAVERGVKEGIEKAVEKAKEETILEEKIEIARIMLKKGIDDNTICECTGLSSHQLEDLR